MIDSVLQLARKEVGVQEVGGNNRGRRVEEYLAAVGLGPGQPWCAAFIAWCMRAAGVQGWPATGDTWALEDWARARGVLHDDPQRGDVFLVLGADGRPVHTGFVAAVQSEYVSTIEGNTGMRSDFDGDGVAAKSRYDGQNMIYIRWADALRPPLRVVLAGREIACHPQRGEVTRCDLRPLAEALGYIVDATPDTITLRRKG